jgi:hypothetical protein
MSFIEKLIVRRGMKTESDGLAFRLRGRIRFMLRRVRALQAANPPSQAALEQAKGSGDRNEDR